MNIVNNCETSRLAHPVPVSLILSLVIKISLIFRTVLGQHRNFLEYQLALPTRPMRGSGPKYILSDAKYILFLC